MALGSTHGGATFLSCPLPFQRSTDNNGPDCVFQLDTITMGLRTMEESRPLDSSPCCDYVMILHTSRLCDCTLHLWQPSIPVCWYRYIQHGLSYWFAVSRPPCVLGVVRHIHFSSPLSTKSHCHCQLQHVSSINHAPSAIVLVGGKEATLWIS